jgi:hypothetical protein
LPTNNTVTKGTKLPKNGTVIKKLSFALDALSLSMATQFLRCRGRSLYSGAKYTRFIPKIAAMQKSLF